MELPYISIVIPTANHPDDVDRCLASLASLSYPRWEAIVIDQSDDERTRMVVERFRQRVPSLAYRRAPERGKTRACNLGTVATGGDLVFFLDHDCVLPAEALREAAAAAERHPRAAILYGAVRLPAEYETQPQDGWIPTWEPSAEVEGSAQDGLRRRLTLPQLFGMGACMVVRRAAMVRIGPFDVHLGPGARFQAGEEDDYAYRALMAGYTVAHIPDLYCVHYGYRANSSGAAAEHRESYDFAYGAVTMKAVRLGDLCAPVWMMLHLLWMALDLRHGPQRGARLAIIGAFARGAFASFRFGVDRRRKVYTTRTSLRTGWVRRG